jgi:uncharacterized protein YjbJ (UPF0337 family)
MSGRFRLDVSGCSSPWKGRVDDWGNCTQRAFIQNPNWRVAMNWDQIAGQWKQMKGHVRQQWGKLTDNDLEVIAGSKDKLVGTIQERYGVAKEEAQTQLEQWCKHVQLPQSGQRGSAA